MTYDDIFKILYNFKLHPEKVERIENRRIEWQDEETPKTDYYIEVRNTEIILCINYGIQIRIDCNIEQSSEASHYLDEIYERLCKYHINKIMNSIEL